MKLPEPVAVCKCPKCGRDSNIEWRDHAAYWTTETTWECPTCRALVSTDELQSADGKVGDK